MRGRAQQRAIRRVSGGDGDGVWEGNFWAYQPVSKGHLGTTMSTCLPLQGHRGTGTSQRSSAGWGTLAALLADATQP